MKGDGSQIAPEKIGVDKCRCASYSWVSCICKLVNVPVRCGGSPENWQQTEMPLSRPLAAALMDCWRCILTCSFHNPALYRKRLVQETKQLVHSKRLAVTPTSLQAVRTVYRQIAFSIHPNKSILVRSVPFQGLQVQPSCLEIR